MKEKIQERIDILMMVIINMRDYEHIKPSHYQELVDQVDKLQVLISDLWTPQE